MQEKHSPAKLIILGIQHLFAMFGATVLVPKLTGLNPAVALICAGVGTLVFHLITGGKVPVFLGSSFAYIVAMEMVIGKDSAKDLSKIPVAQGGIIFSGILYILIALLVYIIGVDRVKNLFPPIITGPVTMVIGLTLSSNAIDMASQNWAVALITLFTVIIVTIFSKGFFKLVPILIGIFVGYICAFGFDMFTTGTKLIDFSLVSQAPFISPFWDFSSGEFFTLPVFKLDAIIAIAPIALVTFMEHIGDMTTSGMVVGKDFIKDPGLYRTILGDGVATIVSGAVGGPANTTYSENTGVLAVTKVYDPKVLRIAAIFAIILGLFGKFASVLQTIPNAVLGGVSIVLFGMIASAGLQTVGKAKINFSESRSMIVVGTILVIGIGMSKGITLFGISFSGLFVAVIFGVLLNQILPNNKKQEV